MASAAGSRNVAGNPGGNGTPSASRYRAASSTAINAFAAGRSRTRTRLARSHQCRRSSRQLPDSHARAQSPQRSRSPSRSSKSWTPSGCAPDTRDRAIATAPPPLRWRSDRAVREDRVCPESPRNCDPDQSTRPARAAPPAAHRRRRYNSRHRKTAGQQRKATAFPSPRVVTRISPRSMLRQNLLRRRHIEEIAQALAIALQQNRKRGISRRHRQQIRGALALLPQRRALPRRGVSAAASARPAASRNFAANSERRAQLPQHQFAQLLRRRQQQCSLRSASSLSGKRSTNPSSDHMVSHFHATLGAQLRRHRHAPRSMHAAAEWRKHANAPVAQFVAAHAPSRCPGRWALVAWRRPALRDSASGFRRHSHPGCVRSTSCVNAAVRGIRSSSRVIAPMCRPNSAGRPGASPCQNGILPGSPGAGETITRSWVISSIRQRGSAEHESFRRRGSRKPSPRRVRRRARLSLRPARNTPYSPRSGIVPPFRMAMRLAPCRGVSGW